MATWDSDSTFYFTWSVCSIILVLVYIIFSVLREKWPTFYQPKRFANPSEFPEERVPYIGWLYHTLMFPEKKLLGNVGYDGVVYLRFVKYNIIFLLLLSIISLAVLAPINAAGKEHLTGLSKLTLANIKAGDDALWAHLVFAVLFSCLGYFHISRLYNSCINLDDRLKKLTSIKTRAVMVSSLTDDINSEEALKQCFVKMYGKHKVVDAILIPKLTELRALMIQRRELVRKYKRAKDLLSEPPSNWVWLMQKVKYPFFQPTDTGVDYVSVFKRDIEDVDKKILELQANAQSREFTDCGVVLFESVATAMECAQTLLDPNPLKMQTERAPHPMDINWKYFGDGKLERTVRKIGIFTVVALLFLFWTIPVGFLSAFTTLDQLDKVPAFRPLTDSVQKQDESVQNAIANFLSSSILTIFLTILPYLLRFLMKEAGYRVNSLLERRLVRVYWLFLFTNVFFLFTLAGSLWDVGEEFVKHPEDVVKLLAQSLPERSTYFIDYMILQGWAGYPIFWLLRADELLLCLLKKAFLCQTRAERLKVENPMPFDYGVLYSRELIIFTIALVYSTMAPVVLPFAVMYFALAYVSAKHNFIYVYKPQWQGNKIVHQVMNRAVVAVFTFQITMVGMLGLKVFPYGTFMGFMAIMTILFRMFVARRYVKAFRYLALRECPSRQDIEEAPLDESNLQESFLSTSTKTAAGAPSKSWDRKKFRRYYNHPALRPPGAPEADVNQRDSLHLGPDWKDTELTEISLSNVNIEELYDPDDFYGWVFEEIF